jgi:predicted PurR-regulated permease PerM
VSQALVIFSILLFTLLEADQTATKLEALARGRDRPPGRVEGMFARLQRYLDFKMGMGLLDGVLTGVVTALLGVGFAPLWGLLTFVLSFVPRLGSLVATIPPVGVALLQVGPARALMLLGSYVALHTLLSIVEPRLVGFGRRPPADVQAPRRGFPRRPGNARTRGRVPCDDVSR